MHPGKNYSISLVILITLFQISDLVAQEKSEKPGFAVHTGVGSLFAGAGVMMEYQFLLTERIKFDPFLAIGSQAHTTETPDMWWGYTTGANLEFGKIFFDHGTAFNWLIGCNYGSQGVGSDRAFIYDSDSSKLYIDKHLLTGFALIGGYKCINRNGFTFQINMGMCCLQNPVGTSTHHFFKPTGSLGVGYKF